MIAPTKPAHTNNETGEKRKTKEKGEKQSKQRKNKVQLNTQKEETTKDIKEKIREQGEKVLDTEQGFQMEIQLEWSMQHKCTIFNLCTAFVNLINKMGPVDPSICVKSEVTKEVWKFPSNISSGKAFNTTFNVKQESLFKGVSKAKAYETVVTKTWFNTIKHYHDVWNYIKACNVYVKPEVQEEQRH
eukprot:13128683-Ditylum_brightwellii.AAC.1